MTQFPVEESKSSSPHGEMPSSPISVSWANEICSQVENHSLIGDEKWYVVACDWWEKFVHAIGNDSLSRLGPIDNTTILDEAGMLKSNLVEKLDFTLVPASAFARLREAFHVRDEKRDAIERVVVSSGLFRRQNHVEIYPLVVEVASASEKLKTTRLQLSRVETLGRFREKALSALGLPDNANVRLYISHDGGQFEQIPSRDEDPVDSLLATGQHVLVDVLDSQGLGVLSPRSRSDDTRVASLFGPTSNSVSSSSSSNALVTYASSQGTQGSCVPGICGLQNLGNTCFMNSALQCLSNLEELTSYFLSGRFKQDLNETNPLGMNGRLAVAYAELIGQMWSGRHSSVLPRRLKTVIGEFAPRFSGYAQQDSQELLSFLLDGLHEDLNRVRAKPYVEEKDSPGRDEELAARAWDDYRRRNDSVIVDLMHGQLKSTLVCPVCNKVSVKFDPFCFLSVPLPVREKPRNLTLTYVPMNPGESMTKFGIVFAKSITVAEARNELLALLGKTKQLLFAIVQQRRVVRLLADDSPLQISYAYPCPEIWVFEIENVPVKAVVALEHMDPHRAGLLHPVLLAFPTVPAISSEFVDAVLLPRFQEMFALTPAMAAGSNDVFTKYELRVAALGERDDAPLSENEPVHVGEGDPLLVAVRMKWQSSKYFESVKGEKRVDVNMIAPMQKQNVSIYDCIDLFTTEEQLSETDSWYCPQCKKHERASKKLDLWRLPQILIVHLKRFQYSRWSREKIETAIHLPLKGLQLHHKVINTAHEEAVYDLMAVSEHMGGLGGGHYSASALRRNGQWVRFNDSSATETNTPNDPLISRDAYIAFYRRRPPLADANIEMELED